jgi:ssDNA-binding Zn-finger/Zn-ribbon topoisomerase 1
MSLSATESEVPAEVPTGIKELWPRFEELHELYKEGRELARRLSATPRLVHICRECGAPGIVVERKGWREIICSRYHEAAVEFYSLEPDDPRRERFLPVLEAHPGRGRSLEERENPEYREIKKQVDEHYRIRQKAVWELEDRIDELPLLEEEREYWKAVAAAAAGGYGIELLSVSTWSKRC